MGDCAEVASQLGSTAKVQTATQEAFSYTATNSKFTFSTKNGVDFDVTFLSPIFPKDYKRQSLVSSYLTVSPYATDGSSHSVQVYTDIGGDWASVDTSAVVEWASKSSKDGKTFSHTLSRQNQLLFTEEKSYNGGVAYWGEWLYTTNIDNKTMSWQTGSNTQVRTQFVQKGSLANTGDTKFRAVEDNTPVFAFSHNLGSVTKAGASATWTIGLYQDDVLQFLSKTGLKNMKPYWSNFWTDPLDAASEFFQDYSYAVSEMSKTDDRIQTDSVAKGGQDLASLTTLAYRQAYGSTQLCGDDVDDPYLFMKEISSDGNVQTTDVMFPAFPVWYYDNPELIALILKPLFEDQDNGLYFMDYAMHDLGFFWPNGTGYDTPGGGEFSGGEPQPVEESGNMIVMSLAYAQATNNTDFLSQHYTTLTKWTNYLIGSALYPVGVNASGTDDFAPSIDNQTNLALKGIIGIKAASQIADLIGKEDDSQSWNKTANDYLSSWLAVSQDKGTSLAPHLALAYGDNDSYGLMYNLYADKVLRLNFIPQSIYDLQSNFYPTVFGKYGVLLDTRYTFTKLDWQVWCAAIASPETAKKWYGVLATWLNETLTTGPLTDLYEVETGIYTDPTSSELHYAYRAVVGGMFAPLII